MHLTFEYPALLLLLLLLPCFYYCRKIGQRRRLAKVVWLPRTNRFFHRQLLLRMLLFSLVVVALANPISYTALAPSHRKGVAIVLALDTSGSMRERGFGKGDATKFALLQRLAADFIDKRRGDNIGVVAFGTFAFAASPVSYDIEGVKQLLSMLEVEIAGKNTAIGDAIVESLKTIQKSGAKEKIIVLVTDGKNNSGKVSPKAAVEAARRQGVEIYTIGIGAPGDYDSVVLRHIAQESGGKMFTATKASDLGRVYDAIDKLLPTPLRSSHYLHKRAYFIYPLLGAIALLIWMLANSGGGRRSGIV